MALTLVDVSADEQKDLFSMIAAVLQLGQINLIPKASNEDESEVDPKSAAAVAIVAELVGRDSAALSKAITSRTVTANRDVYQVALTHDEGMACRDALAKAIYTAQFNMLVNRINQAISVTEADKVRGEGEGREREREKERMT
jgi:myosin heavy subunit